MSVALAVLPEPPFVDDTLSLILFRIPAVVAVTSIMTVQEFPPAMLPPVKLIVFPPDPAVTAPPQLLARFNGFALTTPVG